MEIKPDIIVGQAFDVFSNYVSKNNRSITPAEFARNFINLRHQYCKSITRDEFCYEADKLASGYIKNNNFDFAGIIYSTLCKITEYFPGELEYFASKGYELAAAKGDYVHMAARLNDLRKVYMDRPDRLHKYVKTLLYQEKCLKQLTKHYDNAVEAYNSVQRKPAKKTDYELQLAYTQLELGKLMKNRHPIEALSKLFSARKIFINRGLAKRIQYTDYLVSDIKNILTKEAI